MPVLILAGGIGTRMSELTSLMPKPMVEIGGKPILWHLIMYYRQFGFRNFVICAGYKSYVIKEYFENLLYIDSSVSFEYTHGVDKTIFDIEPVYNDLKVTVLETGLNTMTGGRVAQALDFLKLKSEDCFALTYGDGLTDVSLAAELDSFLASRKKGIILGVHPMARFGLLEVDESNLVCKFQEKPHTEHDYINGGFFFFRGCFRNYLSNDKSCILEKEPLERLAQEKELVFFKHEGFWQCIDTLKDKNYINDLWDNKAAPWKIWS